MLRDRAYLVPAYLWKGWTCSSQPCRKGCSLEFLVASPFEEYNLLQVPGHLSQLKITVRGERREPWPGKKGIFLCCYYGSVLYAHVFFLLHALFCLSMHTKVHLPDFVSLSSMLYIVQNLILTVCLILPTSVSQFPVCVSLSKCGGGVNEQIKLLWVCEVSIFVLPHAERWQYLAWTGSVWEWVGGWEVCERRETRVELLSMKYFKYGMHIIGLEENFVC